MITPDTVPLPSPHVVIRREKVGALLFQVQTDEMYSLSESSLTLFGLLDGTRDLREITELVRNRSQDPDVSLAEEQIMNFTRQLAARQLIELW